MPLNDYIRQHRTSLQEGKSTISRGEINLAKQRSLDEEYDSHQERLVARWNHLKETFYILQMKEYAVIKGCSGPELHNLERETLFLRFLGLIGRCYDRFSNEISLDEYKEPSNNKIVSSDSSTSMLTEIVKVGDFKSNYGIESTISVSSSSLGPAGYSSSGGSSIITERTYNNSRLTYIPLNLSTRIDSILMSGFFIYIGDFGITIPVGLLRDANTVSSTWQAMKDMQEEIFVLDRPKLPEF